MKVLHIIIGFLIVAAGLGGASAAELDYQLVWSDEFDGSGVDPVKWSFQTGDGCPNLCGWGNNELQYYRGSSAIVSGGLLTITAREENFGGRNYTSARMRTIDLGDWTYGRFEMRGHDADRPGAVAGVLDASYRQHLRRLGVQRRDRHHGVPRP